MDHQVFTVSGSFSKLLVEPEINEFAVLRDSENRECQHRRGRVDQRRTDAPDVTDNDVVLCVTAPFTLPYAVVLAAKLRRAATLLLIYDLYPEALEAAGLIKPTSVAARLLRFANSLVFPRLDTIIVIGRDVPPLLTRYQGVAPERIQFIPNWVLLPIGYREIDPRNRFRAQLKSKFIVGLSGNLGFTHAPATVFEAAKLLKAEKDIHFILSGWESAGRT